MTVKESVKGGAIAGICTMAGGVVGGPAGLAVGGAFGGCLAAYLAQDKFLPVSAVRFDHGQYDERCRKCQKCTGHQYLYDTMNPVTPEMPKMFWSHTFDR